jgi:hypothetical protein
MILSVANRDEVFGTHRYLASSNQWALTLRLTDTPLLVPELLKLIDQSCKSNPDARLANVVLDVIWSELSLEKPGQKPR